MTELKQACKQKCFLFASGCHKNARNGSAFSIEKGDCAYLVRQFQLRSVAAWLPLRCSTFSSSFATCTQYINLLAYSRGNGELSSALDDSVASAYVLVKV